MSVRDEKIVAGCMGFLKIVLFTGAAFLTLFLGYKYLMDRPPGYCSAQQRFISDEEFIRASKKVIEWSDKEYERYLKQQRLDSPDTYNNKYQGYVSQLMERPDAYQQRKQNQENLGLYQVSRGGADMVVGWLFDYEQVRVTVGPLRLTYDVCGTLLETKPNIMRPGLLNTAEILTQELPSPHIKGEQE